MSNTGLINGVSAICNFSSAFEALKKEIKDINRLEVAIQDIIATVTKVNHCFNNTALSNSSDGNGLELGRYITAGFDKAIVNALNSNIPALVHNNRIEIPVKIDYSKPINIVLELDGNENTAADIAQDLLFSKIKRNTSINFRCADFVRGGNFLSNLYSVVSQLSSKSGGQIYTKQTQFEELIKELERVSSNVLSKKGNHYSSAYEHNMNSEDKLEEYFSIVYLNKTGYNNDDIERLALLFDNRTSNGMSFVIVGEKNVVHRFKEKSDLYIRVTETGIYAGKNDCLEFIAKDNAFSSVTSVDSIVNAVRQSEVIDTALNNNKQLLGNCQSMDSDVMLRIPFAIDRNSKIQYFEIGGEAPSHALLSGTTGSGKSVALHTLIMQIIYNYHPDDVELWAIDYKAVEFDSYIDKEIPHFKVIAHDTSVEFSLSLIDLLYEEYNTRMKLFLREGVKNITEYRHKVGRHSMPRIVVVIDEFQILTQAVQSYTGTKDYRTMLENLLRLTRAMGISFILCSQTIASGLSGLTESARDQIGCRLSLKHNDENEIRETLMLWGHDNSGVISHAKNLSRGEAIYKRNKMANEVSEDGKPYEFKDVHILYIDEQLKQQMLEITKRLLGESYTKKDVIVVRGGGRVYLNEKKRHPISRFIEGKYTPEDECVEWYPAAPTTLEDSFMVRIENYSGANILLVGENDEFRDSIVLHSLCGFLMNPNNRIVANFIDEEYSDRKRLLEIVKRIESPRLIINEGIKQALEDIRHISRIQRANKVNEIHLWYGLDKLKNELFLINQESESKDNYKEDESKQSMDDIASDLMEYLKKINGDYSSHNEKDLETEALSYEECKSILRQAFEMGSENNQFHMVIFNNNKVLKKSGVSSLECFENRIGSRMSIDDSFELFGSSMAIEKTDENTVIYYAGSGNTVPLKPYKMPSEGWINKYNSALRSIDV